MTDHASRAGYRAAEEEADWLRRTRDVPEERYGEPMPRPTPAKVRSDWCPANEGVSTKHTRCEGEGCGAPASAVWCYRPKYDAVLCGRCHHRRKKEENVSVIQND